MNRLIIFFLLTIFSVDVNAQQKPAGASAKYEFFSDPMLNAHLFYFGQAARARALKMPDDSIRAAVHQKFGPALTVPEELVITDAIRFYRDSVVIRDLLFDAGMRSLSDQIVTGKAIATDGFASRTLAVLEKPAAIYGKYLWKVQDSLNHRWMDSALLKLDLLEQIILPQLEQVYQEKLPAGKVRVDLTGYATFTGAFTYNETFPHIFISSTDRFNQGTLAPEVLFHEISHLLTDKINGMIVKAATGKDVKRDLNLWHNIVFYTTAWLLGQTSWARETGFMPFYKQLQFEQRIPGFKISVEACDRFWIPYLEKKTSLETAVGSIVDYVIANDK